jgi:hypothetical protein
VLHDLCIIYDCSVSVGCVATCGSLEQMNEWMNEWMTDASIDEVLGDAVHSEAM